jgi:hypothetical protein
MVNLANLDGKGFFINDLRLQTAAAWSEKCAAAGAKRVMLKVDSAMNVGRLAPAAAAFKAKGISVEAWHYILPKDPVGSARRAALDCATMELATGRAIGAFHVDAEGPYNLPGNIDELAARAYMGELRARLGKTVPIGLCSYRYPSYQPNFPWLAFVYASDFHSPQVYWVGAHNPGFQLRKSIAELLKIRKLPVIPVGAAYSEKVKINGHTQVWWSSPPELEEFMDAAAAAKCPGLGVWFADEMFSVNWWEFKGSTVAMRQAWVKTFSLPWP